MEINKSICGADCSKCPRKDECKGCFKANGCPFGGRCKAAEYIKAFGIEYYIQFKEQLKTEINTLLLALDIPKTDELFEIVGEYVNLEFTFPSGEKVKLLDDKNIYLGTQIEFANLGIC